MNGLMSGLAASFAVTGLYALFVAGREVELRTRLATWDTGRRRVRAMRVVVNAVRGRPAATTASLLSVLVIVMVAVSAWALLLVGAYTGSMSDQAQAVAASSQALEQSVLDLLNESEDASPPEPTLLERLDAARAMTQELERIQRTATGLRWILVFLSTLTWAVASWMLMVWRPLVIAGALISHELGRFTLRLQGLATKAEIVELMTVESKVRHEQSLVDYFAVMHKIADRHGIAELVGTLDLLRTWVGVVGNDPA
jgi:hypothetical protein